jgi:hypothetical protein
MYPEGQRIVDAYLVPEPEPEPEPGGPPPPFSPPPEYSSPAPVVTSLARGHIVPVQTRQRNTSPPGPTITRTRRASESRPPPQPFMPGGSTRPPGAVTHPCMQPIHPGVQPVYHGVQPVYHGVQPVRPGVQPIHLGVQPTWASMHIPAPDQHARQNGIHGAWPNQPIFHQPVRTTAPQHNPHLGRRNSTNAPPQPQGLHNSTSGPIQSRQPVAVGSARHPSDNLRARPENDPPRGGNPMGSTRNQPPVQCPTTWGPVLASGPGRCPNTPAHHAGVLHIADGTHILERFTRPRASRY